MASAAPISFAVRVDARNLDLTVRRALRDVERVKRVALVRVANNVKRWMLEAVDNNGGVIHRKTGKQVVPKFRKMSELHDVLHGTATGGVLARKESVLLNIDVATGSASVGWAGRLAAMVERWQDGTVGGERRLCDNRTRHAIYRILHARGYGVADHEKAKNWLDSQPRQPRRKFASAIAAYVEPLLAAWYEGALKSAVERRNDRYLDHVLDSGESPFTRIAARKASAARYAAKIAYYKTDEYAAIRAARKRELADARNARRRARRAQRRRTTA